MGRLSVGVVQRAEEAEAKDLGPCDHFGGRPGDSRPSPSRQPVEAVYPVDFDPLHYPSWDKILSPTEAGVMVNGPHRVQDPGFPATRGPAFHVVVLLNRCPSKRQAAREILELWSIPGNLKRHGPGLGRSHSSGGVPTFFEN